MPVIDPYDEHLQELMAAMEAARSRGENATADAVADSCVEVEVAEKRAKGVDGTRGVLMPSCGNWDYPLMMRWMVRLRKRHQTPTM